jgi:hypothetical protein
MLSRNINIPVMLSWNGVEAKHLGRGYPPLVKGAYPHPRPLSLWERGASPFPIRKGEG